VPKRLTGTWVIEKEDAKNLDSLIVGRDYYRRITYTTVTESRKAVEMDSSIIILGDRIYEKDDGNLKGGYPFKFEGDSIVVTIIDDHLIEYGRLAFLRKIDYGYILNIKQKDKGDWWELRFIDTRNRGATYIKGLKKKDIDFFKKHTIPNEEFDHYIQAHWSKKDLKEMIDAGVFSDTLLVLRADEKM
jgi:hypothetical protein